MTTRLPHNAASGVPNNQRWRLLTYCSTAAAVAGWEWRLRLRFARCSGGGGGDDDANVDAPKWLIDTTTMTTTTLGRSSGRPEWQKVLIGGEQPIGSPFFLSTTAATADVASPSSDSQPEHRQSAAACDTWIGTPSALYRLYIGIADGMSSARVYACRYPK